MDEFALLVRIFDSRGAGKWGQMCGENFYNCRLRIPSRVRSKGEQACRWVDARS